MKLGFYRAFEERYYAPRSVIRQLRQQYLPFIKALVEEYPKGHTYDAGCGRGEWLELMLEEGLLPYGVDLDDGMLSSCFELGLPAEKGDAVEFIASLADNSQVVVSAFHVVEHIPFEALQTFVSEALRVLKPGGLLIMETPNPENIKVATESFYLDPTHIKPIPSALLSFLPEFYGFERTKVLRLQESDVLVGQESITLLQVIQGVSPDYAVIAQKKGDAGLLENFDDVFSQDVGLMLTTLTSKFECRLQKIESKAEQAELRAEQAEFRAEEAEASAGKAKASAEKAEARAEQGCIMLQAAYDSSSWRFIAKIRKLLGFFRGNNQK
ncbi:MAG: class I SAM-dependent methyltransferase [Oleispira sp.]|nr:class I SAM-dependent methyltransferase [Oleispira sp.]